ncbi:serine/threonine-protein kinase/endoribonuclease IRE1-like [Amphibalanus amphitrite]|uniref:serine/threonine-protein kinase/endoribonuclease IRE1-like n=1 Tax=Amphibalanus amphitrite TaxID=1232801 RepID=UPI001C92211C|nr:serine/threonine-protein kinase/endoribonuclease IRE1-like [Amphibalanus amphitrite]
MGGQVSSELRVVKEVRKGEVISVGSIKYNKKKLLGEGSFGTAVYQGQCGRRENVAVKRILYIDEKQEDFIEKEIRHLQKLEEDGINVIRYYHVEKSKRFYFIAMELAVGTVDDYVERKQHTSEVDEIAILRDSSIALEWLHGQTIIHRDIKPSNILLVKNKRGETVAKLADFGVSKDLTTSKWTMSGTVGTQGWMAPEVIAGEQETPGAADVFSLGLVFFYVLSKGRHPFFKTARHMKMNIRDAEACLEAFQEGSAKTLIAEMIRLLPKDRPSSKYVANHPTFWNEEKRNNFIQVISDVIKDGNDEELRAVVNKDPTRVFGEEQGEPKDWRKIIDTSLDKSSFKSYKEPTTFELLRLVRNKLHHFNELSEEVRSSMGFSTPSGLVDYIAGMFPLLLVHVWEAARIRRDKPHLRKFYTAVDAIIKVGPNTIILPAGVGLIELTELRSSRETVERLSVTAADLPRLREQLPEGLRRLNVRGPEVTEPRWPGESRWDGLCDT